MNDELIFNHVAEALLSNYTCVCYVNASTYAYRIFSTDKWFGSLSLPFSGDNFFAGVTAIASKVIYADDQQIFSEANLREILLEQVRTNTLHLTEYRLVLDGVPVYHRTRLIRGIDPEDGCFIMGVQNVDSQVKSQQKAARSEQERDIYNQIAGSLASHYDTIYYVDLQNDHYFEYSSTDTYKHMQIPETGADFFKETAKNLDLFLHPEDRERIIPLFVKKTMLANLSEKKQILYTYKLFVNNAVLHCRCSLIRCSDNRHLIVGIENINEEITAKEAFEEAKRQNVIFSQMVNGLVSRYEAVFFVDIKSGAYARCANEEGSGFQPAIFLKGDDFYADCRKVADVVVHPDDRKRLIDAIQKEHMLEKLSAQRVYTEEYRRIINGETQYTRLKIMRSEDGSHFIIGFEDISEEVKKNQAQLAALTKANELARTDSLTGAKNLTAYHEFEESLQKSLDSRQGHSPFAVLVCDVNNLKMVNDLKGSAVGDEYIRSAYRLISGVFAHSPVFRIGGDDFAAVLAGSDFDNRLKLIHTLRQQSNKNLVSGNGPTLAVGLAAYDAINDRQVGDVFIRSYDNMREDKNAPQPDILSELPNPVSQVKTQIPSERKRILDGLFEAMSTINESDYIYICDMKYDFSRWTKAAIDAFGLPSEYMYCAGKTWETHVHEEDRDTYRKAINNIFNFTALCCDIQYRARKINGEYTVCVGKGIVLKDKDGCSEYFIGTIKDMGLQSNIDSLTGLKNQYGFFSDIENHLLLNRRTEVTLIGIAKFSEINEVYGYQFGDLVLQKFGRYLFEHTSGCGCVYRLEGTKFAAISAKLSPAEIQEQYENLRAICREGFEIDGRHIFFELNASTLTLDSFNIDPQTVLTCLTFAYTESKTRRHGDLVAFSNTLGSGNKQRIERFRTIRSSITKGFQGFYLMYQPVVDAQTEQLIGAEALIRWRNAEYGVVPPDHFIPLLEQDPLFPELGKWILLTALKDAKKILVSEPDFVINVNLSYTQLERPDFVDMVTSALDATGFPPDHLCLELTERCRLLDLELLKNIAVSLRGKGVLIALDDFGTGFSAIGIVKELPFNTIKIDRTFVKRIEEEGKERDLIRSFVDIANTCGAVVCIEGVETLGMGDILRQYGVYSFQGYYYSKPLEFDAFIRWRENR